MMFPRKEIVEELRKAYPVGSRVELTRMDDFQAPPIGTRGTVTGVDDTGSILVDWDNGSSLNVIYGEDACKKITEWYKVWIVVPGTDGDAENGPCEPTWWNNMVQATSEAEAVIVANEKERIDWETPTDEFPSAKEMGSECPVCTGAKRVSNEEYEAWKAAIDSIPEPPFK